MTQIEVFEECEQSCTEPRALACHGGPVGIVSPFVPKQFCREQKERTFMANHRLRNRFRRRLAAIIDSVPKLLAALKSPTEKQGSQRMCPFCGLITPRSQRLCLECGKPLRGVQLERKDAKQG
jgi:hypothetical protein